MPGAALAMSGQALYRRAVRPWMYTWGAYPDEVNAVLPGDELVAPLTPRTTRGVTIDAPVEHMWPWLAQIGEDRGGFYSYDWLERPLGADVNNVGAVDDESSELHVGASVWLAHRYGPTRRRVGGGSRTKSYLMLMSQGNYSMVLGGEKAHGSWAIYLIPDGRRTRLLARGSGGAVGNATFDIPHFLMEQKMLCGIRDRTQQTD